MALVGLERPPAPKTLDLFHALGYPGRLMKTTLVGALGLGRARLFGALLSCLVPLACGGGAQQAEANWPVNSKKWYDRAAQSLMVGDVDDAELAVVQAERVDPIPTRPEIRLLAAKVALARLDFEAAIKHTEGLTSSEALSTRGRALWYADRISEAADVLEKLVANPEVRDPWAVDIAKLARRGIGRQPFTVSGGLLAVSEMPRVGRSLLVPVELDGEPALAMIATGVSETVVDSSSSAEPKWVSLRFGERVVVKDVPALTKDLSSYSRQLNAPLKVLLGINLLRRLNPTFDLLGGQFVVRTFEPPQAVGATVVPVNYIRGGGMLVRVALGTQTKKTLGSALVDTAMDFPLALDEAGWNKAGKRTSTLTALPGAKGMSHGTVPMIALGALEIPEVPAIFGAPIAEIEKPLGIDLDGIIGSGFLAPFRVTLIDRGRTALLEPAPMAENMAGPAPAPSESTETSPSAPPPNPAPSVPTPAANAPR